MNDYRLPTSDEIQRPRPARFLLRPWLERGFTYRRYSALLKQLAEPGRFHVVPLRELSSAPQDRPIISLRHDVDDRLTTAVRFAELEHAHGLRATYYVLHTAPYYGVTEPGRAEHDGAMLPALRRIQDRLGHEIGFHHDLVTLKHVYGIEPGAYLRDELAWLRDSGIDVRGCAAHGSYWAHRYGFHNNYTFAGWDAPMPGYPATQLACKLEPTHYGLEYDAGHLGESHFFSDSKSDGRGHRWHPELLDLQSLAAGDRVIILIHSCHWDAGIVRKAARLYGRASLSVKERRARARHAERIDPLEARPAAGPEGSERS